MYSRMKLMIVCWRYGIPFNANSCVPTPMNVGLNKMNIFLHYYVFEIDVNDSIFSNNEQQKV